MLEFVYLSNIKYISNQNQYEIFYSVEFLQTIFAHHNNQQFCVFGLKQHYENILWFYDCKLVLQIF